MLPPLQPLPPCLCLRRWKRLTSPGALAAYALALQGDAPAAEAPVPFQPPPIEVREGFEVSLAAAPPLLKYPMMACFDERGRLYVAESDGRNLTTRKEIEAELPRFVRRLTDTDGDGVFDQSTIFADKMTMPEGGLWHNGALYLVSAPYLWRLEDTDDDGVADRREKILGEMEFDGRANQHGPYLGPTGRLYFSGGHFGYQFSGTDGSTTGHSRAGGIFSCRPDGSDVRIDGQGPINPVEIVFTPAGELLSTAAIYDSFGGERHDALIHWFPRGLTQRIYGEPLLPDTGHRVPATIRWGQVAPAGLLRYRGTRFGAEYRDTLFACHFNSNAVRHITLTPEGATFHAEDAAFLTSSSRDFHPADILEDADGSLLLLDTGGWLSWGCPHSQAAKPEVRGAIYRIRRKEGTDVEDPRGATIDWARLSAADLVNLLADSRPAVRDRAQAHLLGRGAAAREPLVRIASPDATEDANLRRRAVFTLSQLPLPAPGLSQPLSLSLRDPDAEVRQAAALSLGELRDGAAVRFLAGALLDKNPAVCRNAATALGRIGDKQSVEPLFHVLRPDSPPAIEHAVRLALIEIGDSGACRPWLESTEVHHQATALRVMEQIDRHSLELATVVPYLRSAVPALRDEARRIVAGRPEWKDQVFALFRELLAEESPAPASAQLAEEIVMGYADDEDFHRLLAGHLADGAAGEASKLLLLQTFGYLVSLPEPLTAAVTALLRDRSARLRGEAVRLVVHTRSYERFRETVDAMVLDHDEEPPIRLTALEAISAQGGSLTAAQFEVAESALQQPDAAPDVKLLAARALSHLQLDKDSPGQSNALVRLVAGAGPFHLGFLLEPFARLDPAKWPPEAFDVLGASLAQALQESPGRGGLNAGQLAALAARFPAAYPRAHRAFANFANFADESAGAGDSAPREERLAKLLAIADSGNASRGRVLFHAHRSTCALCHAVDNRGGTLGPNLSKIGAIRGARDLFEAIVFPSATVVNGFESYLLTDTGGNAHIGLIHRESAGALYLRQPDQTIVRIPRAEVKSMIRSPVSLMPAGLEGILSDQDLADLVAFLQVCK